MYVALCASECESFYVVCQEMANLGWRGGTGASEKTLTLRTGVVKVTNVICENHPVSLDVLDCIINVINVRLGVVFFYLFSWPT